MQTCEENTGQPWFGCVIWKEKLHLNTGIEVISDELHEFHVGKCDFVCEKKMKQKLSFSCVNATNQGTNIAFFQFRTIYKR